ELLQSSHQRIPAALGDTDGEHDEERIKPGFFDDHTVLGKKFGDHRSGNTGVVEIAIDIEAWSDDGGLDRVEHVEARSEITEAVETLIGFQNPVFALGHALGGNVIRAPHLEPPVGTP